MVKWREIALEIATGMNADSEMDESGALGPLDGPKRALKWTKRHHNDFFEKKKKRRKKLEGNEFFAMQFMLKFVPCHF